MNLYILNYNNYYNRIVKKEATLADYLTKDPDYQTLLNTNFNPENGVNTTHVVGGPINWTDRGNYLIAVNDTGDIDSRWFIIDSTRTRAGQFMLTLRRDLVVDYYPYIINSPMYIEKATVQDDDPAIWNSEGVKVNQIKTSEYIMKDPSQSAWIVGYYDPKYLIDIKYDDNGNEISSTPVDKTIKIDQIKPTYNYITSDSIPQWVYENVSQYKYVTATDLTIRLRQYDSLNRVEYYCDITLHKNYTLGSTLTPEWTQTNSTTYPSSLSSYKYMVTVKDGVLIDFASILNKNTNPSAVLNALSLYEPVLAQSSKEGYQKALTYDNAIVHSTSTNSTAIIKAKGYKNIDIKSGIDSDLTTIDGKGALYTYLSEVIGYTSDDPESYLYIQLETTYYEASKGDPYAYLSDISFNLKIPKDANKPNGVPYNIFAIPYNPTAMNIQTQTGDLSIVTSYTQDSILYIAQQIALNMGSFLYDLQLVPFYPTPGQWETIDNTPTIYVGNYKSDGNNYYNHNFTYDKDSNFCCLFPSAVQGSLNSSQLTLYDTTTNNIVNLPLSMTNKKLSNECDMYRLTSPNYNGQFEFTAAKINGITGFECDYTYLPYSPYIKLNPLFDGLYGSDFNDARGLICQGDFSVSYATSQWTEYQISNKNYSNIFNRQMESLELEQNIAQQKDIINIATSTLQGATMGAMAGSQMGVGKITSAAGAAAGAVAGGAVMGAAASQDLYYNNKLRDNAKDSTIDMYNYNLANIQAMPNSLAKVTAYNINNKIFPILEYYTCTDIEKQAVANKIAYNGMTVMRIGTINQFINNNWSYNNIKSQGYIKGKFIKLEDVVLDFTIVNGIADELNKGVFIQ